jgi:hypothetical protein
MANFIGYSKASTVETSTTVANDTAETELAGALTINANSLVDGALIRGFAYGTLINVATPTIQFDLQVNSVDVLSTGALTTDDAINTTAAPWNISYMGTVRTIGPGTTGTIMWGATLVASAGAGAVAFTTPSHNVEADTTADTVNTEADITVRITSTWSAADAANSITCSQHALVAHGGN